MELEENETTVYPRITKEMMKSYMGKPVSIVGKYVSLNVPKLILDVGHDANIIVDGVADLEFNDNSYLEVRGIVTNASTIVMEDLNFFGSSLDLDTFNKMIEMYHHSNYREMNLN